MSIDDTQQFTVDVGGPARVQKLMIAYGSSMNTSSNRLFVAQHFDLVDMNWLSASIDMRNLNPSVQMIGYRYLPNTLDWSSDWSTVNSHEDWFAHIEGDQTSTGRIRSPTDQGYEYLMRPYSGWRQHHIDRTMDYMNNLSWYNGVFMDDSMLNFQLMYSYYSFYKMNGQPCSYAEVESGMKTGWAQGAWDLLNGTQQALGTDMLMPNSGGETSICEDITHVHFYEHFMHNKSNPWDYMPWQNRQGSSRYYVNAINYLHTQANLGNAVAVHSGCSLSSPSDKREQTLKYCLAGLMMICGTDIRNLYFSWMFLNGGESQSVMSSMYLPILNIEYGQPMDSYTGDIQNSAVCKYTHPLCPSSVPDFYDCGYSSDNTWNGTWHRCNYAYCGGVFLREFQNYYVAVNIAPSWHPFYDYDFSSGPLAGYTIPARTGLFIEK